MKGGIACGIVALRALEALGLRPAGDVVFQSVVDEETGGPGTRAALARGHTADAAIVLEPTAREIVTVEGGLEWVRVVVRGRTGHSADPLPLGARRRARRGGERDREGGQAARGGRRARAPLGRAQGAPADAARHHDDQPRRDRRRLGRRRGRACRTAWSRTRTSPTTARSGSRSSTCRTSAARTSGPSSSSMSPASRRPTRGCASIRPRSSGASPACRSRPARSLPDHPLVQALGGAFRAVAGEPRLAGFEAVSDLAWLAAGGHTGGALRARRLRPGALLGRVRRRRRTGRGHRRRGARPLRVVRRRVRTSAFCFAGDLADEGVETVLDNIQGRAGLGGVTMAASYHASRDLFPHARTRHLRFQPGGEVFFRPDPRVWRGPRAAAAAERAGARRRPARGARRGGGVRAASTCRPGRSSCTSTGPRTATRASRSRRASGIPA